MDKATERLAAQLYRGFTPEEREDAREERKEQERLRQKAEKNWINARVGDLLSNIEGEPTPEEVWRAKDRAERERYEIQGQRLKKRREDLFYAAQNHVREEDSPTEKARELQGRVRKAGKITADDRLKYQNLAKKLAPLGHELPELDDFIEGENR